PQADGAVEQHSGDDAAATSAVGHQAQDQPSLHQPEPTREEGEAGGQHAAGVGEHQARPGRRDPDRDQGGCQAGAVGHPVDQPQPRHRPGQVVENGPPAGEDHPDGGDQDEGGGGEEAGTRLGPDGQHRIGASAPELTEAVDVGPGDAAGQGVADGATGQGDDQQGPQSYRQAAGPQQQLLDGGDGEEGDGLGPGGDGDPAP